MNTSHESVSQIEGRREGIDLYLSTCLAEVARLGGLPTPREAREMWGDIWIEEAHQSTAIEGNSLTYTQVAELVRDGKQVSHDHLHDYLEVRGYADAAQWVYCQALEPDGWTGDELITITEVRAVHHAVMGPVWEQYPHPDALDVERPGNFRQHDIRPFEQGMEPPSWPDVPSQIRTWVDAVNQLKGEDTGRTTERIAAVHAGFEHIHPFLDGNGRTGRLLLNLVLVRLGYPPAIISVDRRPDYLAGLHACDCGDPGALGEVIARAMIGTLRRIVFPWITGPGRYVLLSLFADREFSTSHLSYAARMDKLTAEKDEDGFWRSSQVLVDRYKAAQRAKRATRLDPQPTETEASVDTP